MMSAIPFIGFEFPVGWRRSGATGATQPCVASYDRVVTASLPVTRDSLRRVMPMLNPQPMALLPSRVWSIEQWQRLRLGYRAQDMDEKWNVFAEGRTLFCHRSWTGHGIYEVQFQAADEGYRIQTASVESDSGRYRRSSDDYDKVMLELVLTAIVLGEPAADLRAQLVELTVRASGQAEIPPGAIQHSALGLRTNQ